MIWLVRTADDTIIGAFNNETQAGLLAGTDRTWRSEGIYEEDYDGELFDPRTNLKADTRPLGWGE